MIKNSSSTAKRLTLIEKGIKETHGLEEEAAGDEEVTRTRAERKLDHGEEEDEGEENNGDEGFGNEDLV